jgi:hypothetical protein
MTSPELTELHLSGITNRYEDPWSEATDSVRRAIEQLGGRREDAEPLLHEEVRILVLKDEGDILIEMPVYKLDEQLVEYTGLSLILHFIPAERRLIFLEGRWEGGEFEEASTGELPDIEGITTGGEGRRAMIVFYSEEQSVGMNTWGNLVPGLGSEEIDFESLFANPGSQVFP